MVKSGFGKVSKQKHTCSNIYGEMDALPASTLGFQSLDRGPLGQEHPCEVITHYKGLCYLI